MMRGRGRDEEGKDRARDNVRGRSDEASAREREIERMGHALARLLVSNCNEESCMGGSAKASA